MSLPLRLETQVVLRRREGKRKPQPFYGIGQSPKVGGSNPPLGSGEQCIPEDTTGDGQPERKWQVGRLRCTAGPLQTTFSISYKPSGSSSIESIGFDNKTESYAVLRNESLIPKEVYLSVLCTGS
jgi:hypothetical protein